MTFETLEATQGHSSRGQRGPARCWGEGAGGGGGTGVYLAKGAARDGLVARCGPSDMAPPYRAGLPFQALHIHLGQVYQELHIRKAGTLAYQCPVWILLLQPVAACLLHAL